jgi:hypothetical protein
MLSTVIASASIVFISLLFGAATAGGVVGFRT